MNKKNHISKKTYIYPVNLFLPLDQINFIRFYLLLLPKPKSERRMMIHVMISQSSKRRRKGEPLHTEKG